MTALAPMPSAWPIGAVGVFCSVRRDRVLAFALMGWHDLGPQPGPHGAWAHLMAPCACNPDARPATAAAPAGFERRHGHE